MTDDLLNTFEVYQDGSHSVRMAELENPEISVQPPRLFVISNDGEGLELLSESQIEEYLQTLGAETHSQNFNFERFDLCAFLESNNQSLLTVGLLPNSPLQNYLRPAVLDEVQRARQIQPVFPDKHLLGRVFVRYPEFTAETRIEFQNQLQEFHDWKNAQLTKLFEFGVEDLRTPAEQQTDFAVKKAVLQHRKEYLGHTLQADFFFQTAMAMLKQAVSARAEEEMMIEDDGDVEVTYSDITDAEDVSHILNKRAKSERQKQTMREAFNKSVTGFFNYFACSQGERFLVENPPPVSSESQEIVPLPDIDPEELPEEEIQHYEAMKDTLTNQPSGLQ